MELNYNNGSAWNYHLYNPIGSAASYAPTNLDSQFHTQILSAGSQSDKSGKQSASQDSLQDPEFDPSTQQNDVYIKVFSPRNKKDYTMYTLRNFCIDDIHTPEDVREVVFTQVGEGVVCHTLNFQVGYFNKVSKLWLNDAEDVKSALALLKRNKKLTLWCLGLAGKHVEQSDPEDRVRDQEQTSVSKKRRLNSAYEEKATRVIDIKTQLRQKHGAPYSNVQYALWAEMIVGETHEDMDKPPPVPMFSAHRPRGKPSSNSLTDAFTAVADRLVTVLSPNTPQVHKSATEKISSPCKSVELRGNYIQQLKDLVNLRDIGALTDDEYEEQRLVLVNLMRKL